MLRERRHLCRYIRKLAVRPNYYLAWPRPDDYLDEEWVVEMLESLSGSLTLLTTFDWDGLELPSDRLWGAFQARCKALRSISTNVGRHPLTSTSSLFKFSNLTSFSIIARHGIPTSDANQIPEELPDEFWDMILQRCPDLEELAICTFSPTARLFNFDRIIEGSWPSLHSLTLGSFGYTSDFSLGPSALANDGAFDDFLKDHKALKYLRFLWSFRHFMSPDTLSFTLPARSLPALTTFTGIYQQLASSPSPQAIETLDLTCEPIYQSRINAVCAVLRGLPNLTSLEIWVHLFDSNRDHTTFFHNIMAACPGLTDLHFMCTNSFTAKPLKQLVSGLHLLPKLKRFSLTKGHKYLDETMVETASRILRAAPGVKQINVRWARERCPNHLKQEGTYDVVCDETTGLPTSMVAVEKGIGLVGGSFSKSFRRTIDFTPSADWQSGVAKRSKVVRKRVSSMLSVRSSVVYG
ncbi:hypothetical protein DFP72DRAFT_933154 [Ephemerocybe angulata]|uniref:F-box domain-containing protein n=1 Tax=Ephemerocybe angulata TaxID=980116 RepID=A0A8H6HAM9_9AGAR|nr:hypothetical protein DFP72DRAFT_933154 [Tulosesus angulatus]